MAVRMKRTQILLPEEQYRRLQEEAASWRCSLGHLVREAVAKTYLLPPKTARQKAARRLVKMKLPVEDWEEMEKQMVAVRR